MNVKELIEELSQYDENLKIYTAVDPEGHGFNELCDVGTGRYDGYGGMYMGEGTLTEELEAQGYSEEDIHGDLPLCIVIWP